MQFGELPLLLAECRTGTGGQGQGQGKEVMVLLGLIPTSHVTSVSDYVASSLGRSLGWALINFMLSSSLQ